MKLTIPSIKLLQSSCVVTAILCLSACSSAPNPTPPGLDFAPNLSKYTRFELFSQPGSAGQEQRTVGSLSFSINGAFFDVTPDGANSAGRLQVQPDTCRDDPSAECQRRFVVSGRVNLLKTSITCHIPVRNDTTIGYAAQSIIGICQDAYSRSFSINLSPQ